MKLKIWNKIRKKTTLKHDDNLQESPGQNRKSKEAAKKSQATWRETYYSSMRVLKLYYDEYPQMILSNVITTVFGAITPYVGVSLSAQIIEELAGNRNPKRLTTLVLLTLLSAALISLIGALLKRWQSIQGFGNYMKTKHFTAAKNLEMDFCILEKTETCEKLDTIHQNSNGGGWGIGNVLGILNQFISAIFTILGGLALTVSLFVHKVPQSNAHMQFLNHPLFLVLLILAMLAVTYLKPALNTKAGSYYALNSEQHNLGNRLFSYFGFLGYDKEYATDIRIYRQDIICEKYNRNKEDTFHSKGYFARLARGPIGLLHAAADAASAAFTAIAYLFVCLKAWAGAFGVGLVTQYISSITMVSGGMSSLLGCLGDLRNNAPFVKLTLDYLDTPNVMYQGSLTTEKRRDRTYEIEFQDVSFQYPGSNDYALRHVNMKFQVGQRLAVVGQNGSGKTTFIKLLCRLYDPTEGAILLNGIDIRKYNYKDYLELFSVVFQDYTVNAFSLGENVASRTTYDRELALSCLVKAGFGKRFNELPLGLDTPLSKYLSEDGVEMSGGEYQKIALARALYKDAPFIVLDEPTAALDPLAEAEVYNNFNSIIEDKTAIYISHRLSSCKFCDEILVFDKGAVVQKGSHEALVADETGKYHELWNAQAQYYNTTKEPA